MAARKKTDNSIKKPKSFTQEHFIKVPGQKEPERVIIRIEKIDHDNQNNRSKR